MSDIHPNDTDSSVFARHHTIGTKAHQAAAGSHKHDALYALKAGYPDELPGAGVSKNSAQTINGSAIVVMNSVRKLSGGMVLDASGMIQVPLTGWYNVWGNVMFASSVSASRRIVGIAYATPASLPGFSSITGTAVASAQDTASISGLGAPGAAVFLNAGELVGVWANTLINFALDVSQSYFNNIFVTWAGPAS